MDLIKTVRGLDENGAGDDGEHLQSLWTQLVASADSQFHAAEESSLRWLLKSMTGSTEAAETMRRFPLSWTILECIFRRMPLFSLAKTFAFRKFVAVLQQTVTDLAKPDNDQTATKPGKRKRESTTKYDLESLKTNESRLQASESLFKALETLLGRLSDVSSDDKIGAEHVRSLFCIPATDMINIVGPLFAMSELALNSDEATQPDGSEAWIGIIASIWELHLKGEQDADEFATSLWGSTLLIVKKLEEVQIDTTTQNPLRQRWCADLQTFLTKTVIQPAKATFVSQQQSQGPVAITIDVNKTRIGDLAPALYHVLSASAISSELRRRKGETEWMEHVFQIIEEAIRTHENREALLKTLLTRALEKSMPIKVEHLQRICQEYGLKAETRWDILALAVTCDPDVFQVTQVGKDLLKSVCEKILAETKSKDEVDSSMTTIVDGVLRGFRTSRNVPGFLKLWYEQLVAAEDASACPQSPWFHMGQSTGEHSLRASIEQQISAQQLLDVLDWVVAAGVRPQSLSVFLAGVSEGVESDAFADAVCDKISELSQLVEESKSWATALRWRTISRSLAWFPSEKRGETWTSIHKPLGKILKKGDIESAECYEAFKCCCQAWTSMSPDDQRLSETLALLEAFSKRLTSHITEKGLTLPSTPVNLSTATEYDLQKGPGLEQYIAWYARGSSHLAHLTIGDKEVVPLLPSLASEASKSSQATGQAVWEALVENDQVWQDKAATPETVNRLIAGLEESTKNEDQPFPSGCEWLQLLSKAPSDAFTREQREQTMAALVREPRGIVPKYQKTVTSADWRSYLSLLQKTASRPTFYEGMKFEDLTNVSDSICSFVLSGEANDETYLEMIERTTDIATAIFRQMTENVDERSVKYLGDAALLCASVDNHVDTLETGSGEMASLPLRLTLMKCLVTQLSLSPSCCCNEQLTALCTNTRDSLSKLIAALVNRWVNDKKSRRNSTIVFSLYAALDAAHSLGADLDLALLKTSKLRKLDESSHETMAEGDLRGWTIQIFLRTYVPASVGQPLPIVIPRLDNIPKRLREGVVTRMMAAVTKDLSLSQRLDYVSSLIDNLQNGEQVQDAQTMGIDRVVRQMIEFGEAREPGGPPIFSMLYGNLIRCLPRVASHTDATRLCRVLQLHLESSPQPLGQWNIELTLESVCDMSSLRSDDVALPFTGLCKLVEVVIKKHRLRLEGHYHLLTTLLQALLCSLIISANAVESKGPKAQAALAHAYARVLTLICEPTAGAVSRGQQQSSLSSATDAAKRSAGKHMYLVLMQYVKLQLEGGVARPVSEALEPAMNTIFDITSPEGRKILNDAMNASGRAILREMFKRYTKFGKWTGV